MLAHIAPKAKAPEPVAIISRPGCPHCARAKRLLDDRGIVFEDISLGKDVTFSTVRAITGRGTVPQVFIGGRHIGGADDLERYFATQEKRAA
jgi:glutaredoxin-like protein